VPKPSRNVLTKGEQVDFDAAAFSSEGSDVMVVAVVTAKKRSLDDALRLAF
jgi:pyruvate/2-oxoglutarate/acetoin dehydrogenase E1 component